MDVGLKNTLLWTQFVVNPNRAGGPDSSSTFFKRPFLHETRPLWKTFSLIDTIASNNCSRWKMPYANRFTYILSYPQSRDAIASKKGSGGIKFREFSQFIMKFQKFNFFFWFFTVFWGDLEGAGWFSPPLNQETSRSPTVLGLILHKFFLCNLVQNQNI